MSFLHSLTVRGKLAFAFGAVLVLMLLLGGAAQYQMGRIDAQTGQILKYRLAGVRDSGRMVATATRLRIREYRVAVSQPKDIASAVQRYNDAVREVEKADHDYAAMLFDEKERALHDTAIAAWKQYLKSSAKVLEAAQAGDSAKAVELTLGLVKPFDAALAAINELTKYNDEEAARDAAAVQQLYETSRTFIVVVLLVAAGTAIGLGLLIARAITRPLDQAVRLAEAVAGGDLSGHVDATGRDEIAKLSRSLGDMVGRLRGIVGEVRSGVDSVGTASSQIAAGNIDLSQRTEEQAANLQQTAASMEQLTSTVRQNADNARAAAQLAEGARGAASEGGEVMGQVVETMARIAESSRRISDIIGVVDSIAFQTNILALNAAVEAARAGEQGRGFAVVASEVRTLAQRSASAAKEIKDLIQRSVDQVGEGSQLVDRAGGAIATLVERVQRVNDLVSEITAASDEQSQGIDQVGNAVSQLDQVTQQNAALVEESAAAAESLRHQASRLTEAMAVFKLEGVAA
jgi:methyl-accepting chemotaxis protein